MKIKYQSLKRISLSRVFAVLLFAMLGLAAVGMQSDFRAAADPAGSSVVGIFTPDYSGSDFEGQSVSVQILRQGPSGVTSTVDYTFTGGTATGGASCTAGVDYVNTGGTITFVPNDFEEFVQVSICQDASVEPDETIVLTLTNPSAGTTISVTQAFARITIVENQVRTFVVTTTNDVTDGICDAAHCSLREAVVSASGAPSADTVTFDPTLFGVPRVIILSARSLPISHPLTITGPGIGLLTVDGDFGRAFVNSSVATLSGMRLIGGLGDGGIENTGSLTLASIRMTTIQPIGDYRGALDNNGGTVSLTDCVIEDNLGSGAEPGLLNRAGGTMTVASTTLANNRGNAGCGIRNLAGTLNVTNVTISGNICTFDGGGIYVDAGTVNINHTTITDNAGDDQGISAGGIQNGGGVVNIRNSIVAGNRGSVEDIDVVGAFVSEGFNLIGANNNSTGFANGVNGDQVGTRAAPLDPLIGALANNGGPTQTHELLAGSTAIDLANPTSELTVDQRGVTRPQDGDNNGTFISDIGSYEDMFGEPTPTPTPPPTPCGSTFVETEPNDTIGAPQVVPSSDQVELVGNITAPGDNDWYQFDVPAGERIWVYMYTLGATVSTDSFIELRDSAGTLVQQDNENGSQATGSSAIAGANAVAGGAYKVRGVDFAQDDTMEPYTLFFDSTSGPAVPEVEPNENIGSATAYTIGSVASGTISATTDVDTFSFTAAAGERLVIQADSDPERDGTEVNPNIRVLDSSGTVLVTVDNDGSCFACPAGTFRRSENHLFTFSTAGTYSVQVISDPTGPTTGTYSLHIWKPTGPVCATPSPTPTATATATPTATPTATATSTPMPTPRETDYDFDGDGRADLAVFRPMPDPANNQWYVRKSSDGGIYQSEWGLETDKIAPADYDGDGKTDLAIWRDEPLDPDRANFYILQSSDNAIRIEQFGRMGDDHSVVGDWDGDGNDDLAVYRNGVGGNSQFFYRPSAQPSVNFVAVDWGVAGDRPVRGDFDGDGKRDAAVFRPSDATWYILQSSNGQTRYDNWGVATDKFVPADYDGDGTTDLAVFRDGTWYIKQSSNEQASYINFGTSTDVLVPADYDGDGHADAAVYRNGTWYLNQTTSGFTAFDFGVATDKPIPGGGN